MEVKMPVDYLNEYINKQLYQSPELNFTILDSLGFYIVKKCIDVNVVNKYYDVYKKSIGSDAKRTKHHLTEVTFELNNQLAEILNEQNFIDFSKNFFDGNVGLYNIRIVKKDLDDKNPVFLHQDIRYHHGTTSRYSFFVPLTKCESKNGGLTFIPGSHKFGYLGDAGAINDQIIPTDLMLATPSVSPGDIIVMNSFTWHKSGENKTGQDRVYYDIHVNDSRDPSVKKVIIGAKQTEYQIDYTPDFIFVNSRMQRMKELYKKIESSNER